MLSLPAVTTAIAPSGDDRFCKIVRIDFERSFQPAVATAYILYPAVTTAIAPSGDDRFMCPAVATAFYTKT